MLRSKQREKERIFISSQIALQLSVIAPTFKKKKKKRKKGNRRRRLYLVYNKSLFGNADGLAASIDQKREEKRRE